ncbi:hypothetical protein EASAB2608_03614 [Streptomyces sp. EAS-AB2608]|nr:hypothetical protein EASAB2608_03614 [Streptomyces sp. EAS-AB2608]
MVSPTRTDRAAFAVVRVVAVRRRPVRGRSGGAFNVDARGRAPGHAFGVGGAVAGRPVRVRSVFGVVGGSPLG